MYIKRRTGAQKVMSYALCRCGKILVLLALAGKMSMKPQLELQPTRFRAEDACNPIYSEPLPCIWQMKAEDAL